MALGGISSCYNAGSPYSILFFKLLSNSLNCQGGRAMRSWVKARLKHRQVFKEDLNFLWGYVQFAIERLSYPFFIAGLEAA